MKKRLIIGGVVFIVILAVAAVAFANGNPPINPGPSAFIGDLLANGNPPINPTP